MNAIGCILVSLGLLAGAASKAGEQAAPEALSFQEQLLLANERYIADNIRARLQVLNDCEGRVRGGAGSPATEWLDLGEGCETTIKREITGLLEFHDRHNARMDQWTTASPVASSASFYRPFQMRAESVRKIKEEEFPGPWPFVAIHWYPHGLLANLAHHPILREGLGLQEGLWLQPDTALYAFFSFYRKVAALPEPAGSLSEFFQRQTGYHPAGSAWAKALGQCEDLQFRRWQRKDYYSYRIVTEPPTFPEGSLPGLVLNMVWCDRSRVGAALDQFYQAKCSFFRVLAGELRAGAARRTRLEPYWELYAFVARSFPQISAFRLTKDEQQAWALVAGYEGDRPARGQFGDGSVMGLAHTLYRQLGPDPRLAEQVFGPILLLQMRLGPAPAPALTDADIRVGFEGYVDFYQRVLSTRAAGEQRNDQ